MTVESRGFSKHTGALITEVKLWPLEGTLRRFGALNVLIAVGDYCGKQAILAGFILLAR